MSNPSLYERLAKIFKSLFPVARALPECNCQGGLVSCEDIGYPGYTCNEDAKDSGDCTRKYLPASGFLDGLCESGGGGGGGDCNCDPAACPEGQTCDNSPGACEPGSTGQSGICVDLAEKCDPAICIGLPSPSPEYTGTAPTPLNGDPDCQVRATNSRGAEACCTDDGWPDIGAGKATMECNLNGSEGGVGKTLHLSVTSDNFTDCKTAAALCIPCNPSDPGYPSYGIKDPKTGAPIDQCNGKIQ
jgi:hypothetical protein